MSTSKPPAPARARSGAGAPPAEAGAADASGKTAEPGVWRSVRIERSGGIAGMQAVAERDAAALTAAERAALERVRRAPPPAPAPPPTRGVPSPADRFRYRIRWTDEAGRETTCTVDEAQMPEALQRLCRPTR